MISFRQAIKSLLTISLVVFISTTIAFSFVSENSWAVTSPTLRISQPQTQIATMMNRVEAATKNIEGKTQETIGNITGNPKDQAMGKAKQIESQALNAVEDAKDNMDLEGRAKQLESQARNTLEDMKAKGRDMLN